LLSPLAHAGQVSYDLDRGEATWELAAKWTTLDGGTDRVQATLSGPEMRGEKALVFDLESLAKASAESVRAWAKREKVAVKVKVVKKTSVQLSASGKSAAKVKKILAEAARVRDAAFEDALGDAGMLRLRGGGLTADHARMAAQHADEVRPLALALAKGTDGDPRRFATRAIQFVQAIPYVRGGADGVRTPVGVLARNRGDCDSKSTLFLALMRAAHPDVPAAIVYVPKHALVALGLTPQKGERVLKRDGRTWVLAEPVGPGQVALGKLGPAAGKLGRAELRPL
jgi:hypothetical protein